MPLRMSGADQANSLNILLQLFDLAGDAVGELTAFLRGRIDRSVQQGIVFIVVGGSDVPLSAHAPAPRCLPGFGNIYCRNRDVLDRRLLDNRGERLLTLHVIGRRARCRTSLYGVFEDCGLPDPQSALRPRPASRKVVLCLLVRLLVLPLRRGPTTKVISQTGDDITGLRAPVRCQLEATAQDAADAELRLGIAVHVAPSPERRCETMGFLAATPQWSEELLSVVCLRVCLSARLSVCASVCLRVCLSVRLSVCASERSERSERR